MAPNPTSPHASCLLTGSMMSQPKPLTVRSCCAVSGWSHMAVFIAGAACNVHNHAQEGRAHCAITQLICESCQSPQPTLLLSLAAALESVLSLVLQEHGLPARKYALLCGDQYAFGLLVLNPKAQEADLKTNCLSWSRWQALCGFQ